MSIYTEKYATLKEEYERRIPTPTSFISNDETSGIMDNLYQITIDDFVKEETAHHDESHGFAHANKVRDLTLTILKNTDTSDVRWEIEKIGKFISAFAMFHDVYDKKYYNQIEINKKITKIKKFIINLGFSDFEATMMIQMIDDLSMTREMMLQYVGKTTDNFGQFQVLRDIVSDADKIDSLGFWGYERIYHYNHTKYYEVNKSMDDVYWHMYQIIVNRLYLVKDEYARTEYGKKLAEIYHEELEYVVDNYMLQQHPHLGT